LKKKVKELKGLAVLSKVILISSIGASAPGPLTAATAAIGDQNG